VIVDHAFVIGELAVVIIAIFMGVRTGGVGVGVWGFVGLFALTVLFGSKPGQPPIDAVFIVITVVTAASVMEAAGGVRWMVSLAAQLLRRHPRSVVFIAPFVSFLFTVGSGTANVFYPLLPVIYDVTYQQKIRPERTLATSVMAGQAGIVCSPVSAAAAAFVAIMAPHGLSLGILLMVTWSASIVAIFAASLVMMRWGKELDHDPEYQRRLLAGAIVPRAVEDVSELPASARLSGIIFLFGVLMIAMMGLFDGLRPIVGQGTEAAPLSITILIQLTMGLVAALIFALCKVRASIVTQQSTFGAGMTGAIALLGIAWLASTFVAANTDMITQMLSELVQDFPATFALALGLTAALTTSQAASTNIIMPIGLTVDLSIPILIGMWPAVTACLVLPANGTQIAAVEYDQTGSTAIGRYVLNHSFLLPTLVYIGVAVPVAILMAGILLGS
jgi:anaerobic C4-dicarboxylate transporter DcuB